MADGQAEAQVLDWLEVEDGASDWFSGFFTFLYGLINPLESLEEDEEQAERRSSGLDDEPEEDEEDEDEERVRQRRMKDEDKGGQKIIIVGLHNQ